MRVLPRVNGIKIRRGFVIREPCGLALGELLQPQNSEGRPVWPYPLFQFGSRVKCWVVKIS
jgi:hypothetical protein